MMKLIKIGKEIVMIYAGNYYVAPFHFSTITLGKELNCRFRAQEQGIFDITVPFTKIVNELDQNFQSVLDLLDFIHATTSPQQLGIKITEAIAPGSILKGAKAVSFMFMGESGVLADVIVPDGYQASFTAEQLDTLGSVSYQPPKGGRIIISQLRY